MSLERTLAGGVRASLISNVLSVGAQAALLAVLARLLKPAEFGLVAAAMVLVKPVQQILFNGLEQAAVLATEMPARVAATLFWLSIIAAGVGVAVLLVAAQVLPLSPELRRATMGLSLVVFGPAVAIVPRVMLRRDMAFGRLAIVETCATVIGFGVVGVACALAGFGAMSLVYGYIGQGAVRAAGCFAFHPRCVEGWALDLPVVRPILSMAGRITGVSLLEIVEAQLPSAFIAGWLGAAAIGEFSQTLSLIATPIQFISQSMTKVASTQFRLMRGDLSQLKQACSSLMEVSSAVTLPVCFGMAAAAGPLVLVVLGPQWTLAARIAPWLALGAAFGVLAHVLAVMNEAAGRLNEKLLIQAVTIVTTAAAFFAGVHGDLMACAQAYFLSRALYLAAQVILSARILGAGAGEMARWIVPGCICSAVIYAGVAGLRILAPLSSTYGQLGLDVAWCALVLVGLYAVFFPRLRRDFLLLAGIG